MYTVKKYKFMYAVTKSHVHGHLGELHPCSDTYPQTGWHVYRLSGYWQLQNGYTFPRVLKNMILASMTFKKYDFR